MSNYNEEIAKELKELNLGGKIIPIEAQDKGTTKDWTELEKNITLKAYENDAIMEQSVLNAKNSLPLG